MTQALMASREIIYPFSDGKRMAENTKQFRWILLIVAGLAQNGHRFNVDQASRPDDVSSGLEADAGQSGLEADAGQSGLEADAG